LHDGAKVRHGAFADAYFFLLVGLRYLCAMLMRLLGYYRPYSRLLVLAVLSNLLMSLFMVVSIPVLQPFLQILFENNAAPPPPAAAVGLMGRINAFFTELVQQRGREGALSVVCALLVGSFLGKNFFRYLSMYWLAPARNGVVHDLRRQLTAKILRLPLSYFSEARKGDLMSRMMTDVQEIEFSILGVVESVAREPLVLLGSLAFMWYTSPELMLFVFGLMLFSGLIIGRIGGSLKRQAHTAQGRLGVIAALAEETLGGLRILKGFNAEAWQMARFGVENAAYARNQTSVYRRKDLASPLSEFLGICSVAVLLWFGAQQVFAGSLSAAAFITFLYAFYNVIEPAKALSAASFNIRKGMGAVERVQAVLDASETIQDAPTAQPVQEFRDKIEFRNVTFQYAGAERAALHHLNLTVPRGKIIALVGASGAGKSTIADLLPRFYDVTAGQILLDGVDIRQLRGADLRGLMGLVSQEAVLFNDTVRNNIACGNEAATDAAVQAAAQAAHAHEFIAALPQGYNSNIGDRGSKLSGGQRQRLTIARALLKNPPILILDEATSALDSESEQLVQAALERLLQHRTAIVIAHRLSTVQHADEIVVLHEGRIVEQGVHADLLAKGSYYAKFVALQAL
jgi:ABC-type multidrug transport system fused ATPase/permease subunit